MAESRERLLLLAKAKMKMAQQGGATQTLEPEPEQPATLGEDLMGVAQTAGQVLDYPGGIARTAIAGATGQGEVADIGKAATGQAPLSAEIMERAGVPAGPALSEVVPEGMYSTTGAGWELQKGGWADPTARGAAGFAADVATDPLTYATGGLSALAKLATRFGKTGKAAAKAAETAVSPATVVANKTADMLGKGGDAMTRASVKGVDEFLVNKRGKMPLSNILAKENIGGSIHSIKDKVEALMQKKGPEREILYDQAAKSGAVINEDDIVKEFGQYTQSIRDKTGIPMDMDMADDLDLWAKNKIFKNEQKSLAEQMGAPTREGFGTLSIKNASDIKSRLYHDLPSSLYVPNTTTLKPGVKEATKKLAEIYRRKIMDAANRAVPDLGNQIDEVNETWGSLIEAQPRLAQEAAKATNINNLTTMDVMYGGGALAVTQDPKVAAMMLGLKKAADYSKTAGFRSRSGQALRGMGKGVEKAGKLAPWIDPGARRYLINQLREE